MMTHADAAAYINAADGPIERSRRKQEMFSFLYSFEYTPTGRPFPTLGRLSTRHPSEQRMPSWRTTLAYKASAASAARYATKLRVWRKHQPELF